MDAERPGEGAGPPALQWRIPWRAIRRQLTIFCGTVATIALVALCTSVLAVWLQGRRDEARSADLLVVVAPAPPTEALLEHSLELFRRGYAPQIMLVGAGGAALRAQLAERGVPEAAMLVTTPEEAAEAISAAQRGGASSALVAGPPAELLLWLKLARDNGLRAYGAPTPGETATLPELLAAGARYWRYALLQR